MAMAMLTPKAGTVAEYVQPRTRTGQGLAEQKILLEDHRSLCLTPDCPCKIASQGGVGEAIGKGDEVPGPYLVAMM